MSISFTLAAMISLHALMKPRSNMSDTDSQGSVIDNEDPEKLGRVKVRMPYHQGVSDDLIPWSRAAHTDVANAGDGVGSTNIPPIGAKVMARHDGGNPYHPTYQGAAPVHDVYSNEGKGTVHADQKGDYPHVRGHTDAAGNTFQVNTKEGKESITQTHITGSTSSTDKDGNMQVASAKDAVVSAKGVVTVVGAKEIHITSQTAVYITAPKVHINGPGAGGQSPVDVKKGTRPKQRDVKNKPNMV